MCHAYGDKQYPPLFLLLPWSLGPEPLGNLVHTDVITAATRAMTGGVRR